MEIILSIKPKYAEDILNGKKIYELRRVFSKKEIDKIIIYESAPTSKIVGEFEIDKVLYEPLEDLRKHTKDLSCIDKKFFDQYFKGKELGFAIKVKNPKRYKKFKPISDYGLKYPPQSYIFVNF